VLSRITVSLVTPPSYRASAAVELPGIAAGFAPVPPPPVPPPVRFVFPPVPVPVPPPLVPPPPLPPEPLVRPPEPLLRLGEELALGRPEDVAEPDGDGLVPVDVLGEELGAGDGLEEVELEGEVLPKVLPEPLPAYWSALEQLTHARAGNCASVAYALSLVTVDM